MTSVTFGGAAIGENEGIITKAELRIDEDGEEAETKLTSRVEGMDENKGVPDLATEVELRKDEAFPKLLVEFKLDVELGLKFRSAV